MSEKNIPFVRLKFISEIRGRVGWQQLRSDEYTDEGPHLVTGMHFNENGSVDWDSCYHVPEERWAMDEGIQLSSGDVLVTKDGTVGKLAYVDDLPGKACLNSHILVIRPTDEQFQGKYLYYVLSSDIFKEYCVQEQRGTTFDAITQTAVENFHLPLYDLAVQKQIVRFLDDHISQIDGLIKKYQRLLDLLNEKQKSYMNKLTTGGKFCEDFKKTPKIPWLDSIPNHWDVIPLRYVAEIRTGIAKGRKQDDDDLVSVPYLRVANVQDGYLDLDNVKEIEINEEEVHRYKLQNGDVLMNEGGDYDKLGRGTVWRGQIEPCVHQNHVFCIRPHNTEDSEWISKLTESPYLKHYFMMNAKRSTNLASISATNIAGSPLVWPPKEERENILSKLKENEHKIEGSEKDIQKMIDLLQEKRQTLITAAVTGQVDVSDWKLTEDNNAKITT